jgi:hypothetical protein
MKRFLFCMVALVLVALVPPMPAFSAFDKPESQVVMAITEVAQGAPVSVTINNRRHRTGYLQVKTENETGAASLVVTVFGNTALGDFLLCTSSAITANQTTTILLGSTLTAAGAIADVCDWPLPGSVTFTFTDSVPATDFDVTASIFWVTD